MVWHRKNAFSRIIAPAGLVLFLASFLFLFRVCEVSASAEAGTIDGTNRYAWGENIGWIDFGTSEGNIQVTDSGLTGYAWGENVGWIDLSPSSGGVNNDGEGTLTGYAWGENVGWIDFAPSGGGVAIDSDGNFSGYAWGENVGWISFSGTVSEGDSYRVNTDWRHYSSRQIIVQQQQAAEAAAAEAAAQAAAEAAAQAAAEAAAAEAAAQAAAEAAAAEAAAQAAAEAAAQAAAEAAAEAAAAEAAAKEAAAAEAAAEAAAAEAAAQAAAEAAAAQAAAEAAAAQAAAETAAAAAEAAEAVAEAAAEAAAEIAAPAAPPPTPAVPVAPVAGTSIGGGMIIPLQYSGGGPTQQSTYVGERVVIAERPPVLPVGAPEPPPQPKQDYIVQTLQIFENSVNLSFFSEGELFNITVALRETKNVDINKDGYHDVSINLEDILFFAENGEDDPKKKEAKIVFKRLPESPEDVVYVKEKSAGEVAKEPSRPRESVSLMIISRYKGKNEVGISMTEDRQPTFKGTTNISNANLYFRVHSENYIIGDAKADSSGYWTWKVPEPLEVGSHSVRITAEDPVNALRNVTQTEEFEVIGPTEKSRLLKAVEVVPTEAIMPHVDAIKGVSEAKEAIKKVLPGAMGEFYEDTVHKVVVEPAAKFYQQEIIENEAVQIVNQEVAAPAITVTAVTNTVTSVPAAASSAVPALNYLLQFLKLLFTEPAYLLAKKRKKWGVVFDSLTKQPIGLATVRLFEIGAEGQKRVSSTKVTGPDGRYFFMVEPGKKYTLQIIKPGYSYPSKLMAGVPSDGTFEDLYYGKTIASRKEGEPALPAGDQAVGKDIIELDKGFISFNIPVDPKEGTVASSSFVHKVKTSVTNLQQLVGLSREKKARDYQKIVRQNMFRKFSKLFAFAGPLVTLVSFAISPGLYTAILLAAHLAFLLFFKKLAVKAPPKPWGEVFNVKKPKEKLARAVIRLFDVQYGRLLLTQVTSGDGRYGFLVGNQKYVLTCEKPGFRLPGDKMEIEGGKEEGIVKRDIGMEPGRVEGGSAMPPTAPPEKEPAPAALEREPSSVPEKPVQSSDRPTEAREPVDLGEQEETKEGRLSERTAIAEEGPEELQDSIEPPEKQGEEATRKVTVEELTGDKPLEDAEEEDESVSFSEILGEDLKV